MIAVNPRRQKGAAREMSVIGRLDGQVEEVIIKPVGRRHAPDERGAHAPDSPTRRRDEPRETHPDNLPEPPSDEPRDGGELPVWLL